MRKTFLVLLIAGALLLLAARPADAIPAFARKYQLSCTACHAPFPRLKPFGEEFAARGFRMEKPESEPARAVLDVGDPLLRLAREFPIAARIEGFGSWTDDSQAKTSFETPSVFKILSGGQLSDRMAYYFYYIIEDGGAGQGLEDAWVQYNRLFDTGVDVIAGQFQVCDPLYKRELRLERNDYAIYKTRVGDVATNLTYDRGLMFAGTAPGDVDLVAMVVNGNGIPEGEWDRDSYKNFALRAAREIGIVRLGAFAYAGKERGASGRDNETRYFGPDLVVTPNDRFQFNATYLRRTDDDPFYVGASDDVVTDGGFAELHWFPRGSDGRYAWSLLYNQVSSDDVNAETENVSITFNYLLARNVRFLAEIGRDVDRDSTQASFGFVTAF